MSVARRWEEVVVGLAEREVEEEEKGWRAEEEVELMLLGREEVELLLEKLREEEGEREVVGRREERSEEDKARRGPLVGWERSIWKICQREEEEEWDWVSETMSSSSSATEERRVVDPFPNPTTRRRSRTSHPPRWIETVPSRSSRRADQGEEGRPGCSFVGLPASSTKISS